MDIVNVFENIRNMALKRYIGRAAVIYLNDGVQKLVTLDSVDIAKEHIVVYTDCNDKHTIRIEDISAVRGL